MQTNAGERLASAAAKLRDHACAALVYQEDEEWRVMPAETLSWLLLMRPEILEQPVSALAQPLKTMSDQDSPATLHWALQAHPWVGVVSEGHLHSLHQWASLLDDPFHSMAPPSRWPPQAIGRRRSDGAHRGRKSHPPPGGGRP
ncbi:hypothetical protein IV102_25080 [bacterium]|nr:hypothetical protein [bacterium]